MTDVDNLKALHNYYELLSSVLRLLVSTFLSRGLQNEQCQYQMRSFLQDYRPNIVGLLKRYNGLTGTALPESKKVLDKIVDAYVALISMANFVEVSPYALLSLYTLTELHSTRRKGCQTAVRTASHRRPQTNTRGDTRTICTNRLHCFSRSLRPKPR